MKKKPAPSSTGGRRCAPCLPVRAETPTNAHVVQFYEGDASFADLVMAYLEAGLRAGDACVVVATGPHRELLEARLRARETTDDGSVEVLDARETLGKFMVDGWPDEKRFGATVGAILRRASNGGRHKVRVFGEMVSVLLAEGNTNATVRLEQLWNQLILELSFSLLCSYPVHALRTEEHHRSIRMICAEHSGVRLP